MKNLALFFLCLITCSLIYASDLTWTPPVMISNVPTDNSSNPQVVMDLSGNTTAIWIENTFVMASNLPNGGSWTPPVYLSRARASSPQLVVDPLGNVTALWIQGGQVITSTYSGGMWSLAPAVLSSTGASSPSLAVDNAGNLAAAWVRLGNVETSTQLYGSGWPLSPQVISATGAASPQIALGGTATPTALVVWHSTASVPAIVFASTTQTGMVWGPTTKISNLTNNAAFAQAAVDLNGNGLAMWYSYDVDAIGTIFSKVSASTASLPFGGSWTSPAVLSNPGVRNPQDLEIQLAFDPNGNAIGMWTASYDDQNFNIETAVLLVGKPWTVPTAIITGLYAYEFDLRADTFGNAYVAYMMSPDGINFFINTAGTYIAGFDNNYVGLWSSSDTISAGMINGYPSLALAFLPVALSPLSVPANSTVAVWTSYDGTNNVIQAATGLGAVVLQPTSLEVVQNAHDYQVFTQYTNTFTWVDSTSPNISFYTVSRNGELVMEIAPGVGTFIDENRHQAVPAVYGIAAVDTQTMQSQIASENYP